MYVWKMLVMLYDSCMTALGKVNITETTLFLSHNIVD